MHVHVAYQAIRYSVGLKWRRGVLNIYTVVAQHTYERCSFLHGIEETIDAYISFSESHLEGLQRLLHGSSRKKGLWDSRLNDWINFSPRLVSTLDPVMPTKSNDGDCLKRVMHPMGRIACKEEIYNCRL